MKIYTRGGDKGTTQVYLDKAVRLDKSDLILHCYGDLDELNSHLGVLACEATDEQASLARIQRQVFSLGFAISASATVPQQEIDWLETRIDAMNETLAPQTRFILPGGTRAAATAHVCRAVCRRAERSMVALARRHQVPDESLAYVNRLSDYLFTLARYLNHQNGMPDVSI